MELVDRILACVKELGSFCSRKTSPLHSVIFFFFYMELRELCEEENSDVTVGHLSHRSANIGCSYL